jgi:hypothetical protein
VTNPRFIDYKLTMSRISDEVNTWFRINLLKLNINKTHILQFNSTNYENCGMLINIGQNSVSIKFLGLNTDNGLTWKNHTDYLGNKLSSSCFIMRTIKSMVTLRSSRMIYFANIHSVMSYGIILWGNSSYTMKLFRIQKKIRRIMMGLKK